MIVVDVNVLVAACVSGHDAHSPARAFLVDALSRDEVIVPDAVWSGFVRVVTNRRAIERPLTTAQAAAFVRAVRASAGYRHVSGLLDDLEPFLRACEGAAATGNLVADAYIAAVAVAHACPVATFDRDFGRFDVEVVVPA